MRRCKYRSNIAWLGQEWALCNDVICGNLDVPFVDPMICGTKKCIKYVPVEVDPYWKDIIDETNRRLEGTK